MNSLALPDLGADQEEEPEPPRPAVSEDALPDPSDLSYEPPQLPPSDDLLSLDASSFAERSGTPLHSTIDVQPQATLSAQELHDLLAPEKLQDDEEEPEPVPDAPVPPLPKSTAGSYQDGLMRRFEPNAAVPMKAANRPVHGTVSKRTRREGYRSVFLGIVVTALLVAVVVLGVTTRGFGVFADFEDRPSDLPGAPEAPVDVIAQLDNSVTLQPEETPAHVWAVEAKGSLPEYTWSELGLIAQEIEAADTRTTGIDIASHYNLMAADGTPFDAAKDVTFSEGVTCPVVLADVCHDDKADGTGKAGLTFICNDLPYVHVMRAGASNQGGWEHSELRAWLNSEVYSTVEEELRPLIVPVFKTTNNLGKSVELTCVTDTQDLLWIPSVMEVGGKVSYQWADEQNKAAYDTILNAEGYQYASFAQRVSNNVQPNEDIAYEYLYDSYAWWLRSPSPSNEAEFRNVDNLGDPSWYENSGKELGVLVGFCL